jgi:hypothetical protein
MVRCVFALALLVAALCYVDAKFDPEANYGTNVHIIDQLDPLVKPDGVAFLRDLRYHEVFVNLRNPVRKGHSARFDVLKGDKSVLESLASKHHISVDGEALTFTPVLPEGSPKAMPPPPQPEVVDADDVHQLSPPVDPPVTTPAKTVEEAANEKRKAFYRLPLEQDDSRKQWYFSNNMAQASKMDPVGRQYVENLLNKLRNLDENTVIQLMTPIRGGNAVRYLLLSGDRSKLESLAAECHVTVSDNLITVPHIRARFGEHHTQTDAALEAEDGDSHVSSDPAPIPFPETGIPDRVAVSRTRKIVQTLPEKWIK